MEGDGAVEALAELLVSHVGARADSNELVYVCVAHALPSKHRPSFHLTTEVQQASMPRSASAPASVTPASKLLLGEAGASSTVPRKDGDRSSIADLHTGVAGSAAMQQRIRARVEASATVTVFLSSPFGGLEEERACFVEQYLPSLRTQCEDKGVALSLVDLRWGITEEQAARFETLEICLQEIDRCDIFVGCYGARYGTRHSEGKEDTHWVGCSVDRATPRYPWLPAHRDKGITELEFRHGVLNDPTARPALFLFRDPAYDEMKARENPLARHKYINATRDSAELRHMLEQEIRELAWTRRELCITAASYAQPQDAAREMFEIIKATLDKVRVWMRVNACGWGTVSV